MIEDPLDWVRVESSWSADFADLSPLAFGAHVRLLLISARRGPLPADRAALARLCGASPRDFARCWPEVSPHWQEVNGSITNAYLEAERSRLRRKRDTFREAGRRGAEQRWQQHSDPTGVANGNGNSLANGKANGQAVAIDGELEQEKELELEVEREADPDLRLRLKPRPIASQSSSVIGRPRGSK